jgi:hypothetical protein
MSQVLFRVIKLSDYILLKHIKFRLSETISWSMFMLLYVKEYNLMTADI